MPELYTLGRWEVLFAPFLPGTQNVNGEDFLGNVPELNLTRAVTRKDHYASTSGVRTKDQSIITEVSMTGSMVADDIRFENIAYFLGTEAQQLTTASLVGQTTSITAVRKGRRYQLGTTPIAPDGARAVTAVVVTSVPSGTTYVLGTDYTLDAEIGMITILETGTIAANSNLLVTFNVSASTRSLVVTGETEIEGSLRFISRAPVGNRVDWFLPWVKLTPNGEFALITEEWETLPFTVEVLRKTGSAVAYAGGRAIV